ncbi:TIGR03757 family integrating conjugative element protein [Zophobihabitans entericus]|uniref:TIGR03757 family integrating conjugative element protein n=1 Tax=Zophobihabitans entericus TaxID=1635327 RepID=A0A6G9IB55_9GAMM|nr:TIGR03757 family integrating conjugative element protein [Zophobihabitans entericus]QIQ21453.1 TIGR03757 family integrating conjugative element protein [Zophobihabitans entericus]
MRNYLYLFVLLFCFNVAHAEIWLVTDSKHQFKNVPADARLILLDEPEQIQSKLNHGLPGYSTNAAAIVKQRLNQPNFHNTLRQALQNVVDAYSYQVTKIPAIVVDKKYIVYGETDVQKAIADINTYRSTHD